MRAIQSTDVGYKMAKMYTKKHISDAKDEEKSEEDNGKGPKGKEHKNVEAYWDEKTKEKRKGMYLWGELDLFKSNPLFILIVGTFTIRSDLFFI